jgi:hypothetical protein
MVHLKGGTVDLVSNSASKFQILEFETLESSCQISNNLLDDTSHNFIPSTTNSSFLDSKFQKASFVCPTTVSSSKMASSPGQAYADDKLDKMLLFLQNMQIKQEEVVTRCEHKLLQNIQAVVTDHDDFKAEVRSEI